MSTLLEPRGASQDVHRIVIFGCGAVAAELAGGLEPTGAQVAIVDPREAGGTAFNHAAAELGGVDTLIWTWTDPDAGQVRALADTSPEQWAALAEEPLHLILLFFKLGHAALSARGGSVILLLPSLAMTGATGVVPWSTAAEGQRSIAKAVARKWGGLGITVNSLAVPAHLLVPGVTDQPLDRPGLPALSLPAPTLRGDVAPLVASLLTPAWRAVTGVTIGVDGGRWMTP